jgi:branched-chain amino acid transport system permease protein
VESHNRDLDCYALFERRMREQIARLITPELIEEHRRHPIGPQSDALARVLNYFRRGSLVGKYAVWARKSFGPYQIIALTGIRGRRPQVVDERQYAALAEIYHAIFLRRIEDFNRTQAGRDEQH